MKKESKYEESAPTPVSKANSLKLITQIYTDADINLETLPNTTQSLYPTSSLKLN